MILFLSSHRFAPDFSYGAPEPSYGAPEPSYGAPEPAYSEPAQEYTSPAYTAEGEVLDIGTLVLPLLVIVGKLFLPFRKSGH